MSDGGGLVKGMTFVLALAALAFASADFMLRTRPLLTERRELRAAAESALADATTRLRKSGAPPNEGEVASAQALAQTLAQQAHEWRSRWFAAAESARDYLIPRAARPSPEDDRSEERVTELLLSLPPELKPFAGVTAEQLGLLIPSLARPFPTEKTVLDDQIERAVATRLLVGVLQAAGSIQVEAARLGRDRQQALRLELTVLVGVNDVVGVYERLLARNDDAPPRRLERFALTRCTPSEWAAAHALIDPPIRLEFALTFDRAEADGAKR